jgi:acyl carrier protein
MSLNKELLHFVRNELATGGDAATIDENTQLIDSGVIDSMALMRLISFVEERTSVRIPDEEVLPENFQSISDIQSLVDRLKSRA